MFAKISAWVVAAAITVLYVFSLVTGIGDVFGMVEMSGLIQQPISGVGVLLLVLGIALPLLAYGVALFLGRQRSAWVRVLLLAAGLCAIAAIDLEVTHLINLSSNFNENIFFAS